MKNFKNLCSTLVLMITIGYLPAQEILTKVYDNREEFLHVNRMSDGNLLVSGKANELGNKSDLVLICDPQGNEVKRVIICDSCPADAIVFSKEAAVGDLIHIRTNGDVYVSDLELNESTLIYNIATTEFESIETYQVLENNHFIVAVSYAVKNAERGLLHTVIDTRNKALVSQKFNAIFPDIAGSIGIDLFQDQSVIDGYNEDVNGVSHGHLLRLSRDRSEIMWEVDLDFGDLVLTNAVVTGDEQIFAVGRIVDVNNPSEWLGLLVSYDSDGNHILTRTYKPSQSTHGEFDYDSRSFGKIEQVAGNRFIITGYQAGDSDGETLSDALVLEINRDGDIHQEHTIHLEERNLTPNDVIRYQNNIVHVGNIYDGNFITGSYISIFDKNLTSTAEVVSGNFSLGPNPASEELFLFGIPPNESFAVSVFDMHGQLMAQTKSQDRISVRPFSEGIYFVKVVMADGESTTMKFMKI